MYKFFREDMLESDTSYKDVVEFNENFYQCCANEEVLNKEIAIAFNRIGVEEKFAFYNLSLSEEEQKLLSEIEIIEFNNVLIHSGFFISLDQKIQKTISNMEGVNIKAEQINAFSDLIVRITNAAIGQIGLEEFELRIRSRESYTNNDGCVYWHLDKTHAEISGTNQNQQEIRFIMPLKGAGTSYQKINETTRNKFLNISENFPYYYGHGLEGCAGEDKISNLLSSSEIHKTKSNFGSLHIAGTNGAMHAAPEISEDRLLLLVSAVF